MAKTKPKKEKQPAVTFPANEVDAIIQGLTQKALQAQNAHQQVLGELRTWQTIKAQIEQSENGKKEKQPSP